MGCPQLELIESVAMGAASDEESQSVKQHLSQCAECRSQMELVTRNMRLAARLAGPGQTGRPVAGAPPSPSQAEADRTPIADHPALTPLPEDAIPGYQIKREISRGGQAVVYQAIQKSTQRKVAIKVLRDGRFADARDRLRFEREVQVLGQLKHPHIVTIHDSGAVHGLPYMVMNYISGKPLDEHVRRWLQQPVESQARTEAVSRTRDLLTLFATVCDAVHAAHLRGVIHRDLKPSNIRVDDQGQPYILDFGIAKVLGPTDLARSERTMTGEFLGSMPWSSPEQAAGNPDQIDIRSDVYSLGVMLFRLLTGRYPYDVTGGVRDVLNRIMHVEPPAPSIAVAQPLPAADDRPEWRNGKTWFRIDGDLDTIVLRCLSKDPVRRYQSAGELALDIRHYLAGEPIAARRDSAMYVLRKNLRRYRVAAAIGAAFLILVSSASVAMVVLYQRELTQRKEAEEQTRRAEGQTRIATQQSYRAEDQTRLAEQRLKEVEQERDRTKHQADLAQRQLNLAVSAQRESQRSLDEARASADLLGVVLSSRGDLALAEPFFRRAVERTRTEHGDTSPEYATALCNLGSLLSAYGRHDDAREYFQQCLAIRRQDTRSESVPLLVQTMHGFGDALFEQGDDRGARDLYREALRLLQGTSGTDALPRLKLMVQLGRTLTRMREFEGAERRLLDADLALGRMDKPPPELGRPLLQALVDLYEQWEKVEPGRGHQKQAGPWRAKLESMRSP